MYLYNILLLYRLQTTVMLAIYKIVRRAEIRFVPEVLFDTEFELLLSC